MITAFVSWATVIALIPVIPRALSLPGLAPVNQQLEAEVQERKRVEERLRQYEAIIESSSDAIIGKALDGTLTSWNLGAERIYGYNSKEAIGQSIFMLISPGDPRDSETILRRISKGERIDSFETRRCCPLAFTRLQPP
ncbi:MAG: PAS domain S-box protein [Planctomycetota bacterium]|nr:PAS domain S-box protein [Planctomycetota bacterium]MDA1140903.1 PAS domain S-box protein [Planctomycetota bacterium]